MSQDNIVTQSEYQKSILAEMGIPCWQIADTSLLDNEVAKALAIENTVPKDELQSQQAQNKETQSGSDSGKSVLQQLSAQLGDKKEAAPAEPVPSEPVTNEVEVVQEVDELLLYQLQGKLAQDIELVLKSIGRSYVTKPLEGKVCYPLVVSDDVAVRDSTSHYFSSQNLNQPQVKKQLWQLLQQS